MRPLNGEKTHALSLAAREKLDDIRRAPRPCSEVNPGVSNRLRREALVEIVRLPSPFKTHARKLIDHLQITDAGLRALAQEQSRER